MIAKYKEHKEKCREEHERKKSCNSEFKLNAKRGHLTSKRPLKQTKLDVVANVGDRKSLKAGTSQVSQTTADKLILRYIVDSMSPISHVEHPSFLSLLHGLAPHIKVVSRWTLSRRILDESKNMKSNIREVFKSRNSICLTADVWNGSKNRRSFMGVTGHVLNHDNLKRESFALACRLFSGSHTFDRIAKILSGIMKEYEIPVVKVTCCVTDNGSNFVKAFREFQVEINDDDQTDEEDDDSADLVQVDLYRLFHSRSVTVNRSDLSIEDSSCDYAADGDGAQGQSLQLECHDDGEHSDSEAGSSQDDDDDDHIALPPHQRCASHTLNLIGCNAPILTANSNPKYRSLFHSCNGKLSGIWNKVNKQKSNEILFSILGCQLLTPVPTRWNSYYDARHNLLLHSSDKLEEVCKSLEVPCFKEQELAFLKEENRVLAPLAESLDRLQGDANPESYMAFLYPTLFQLRHQYASFITDQSEPALRFCSSLARNIVNDLSVRFKDFFAFDDTTNTAALATILHPAFKLRWLAGENASVVDRLKKLFLATLQEYISSKLQKNAGSQDTEEMDSKTLDFFTFMDNVAAEESPSLSLQSRGEIQGLQYLEDRDKTLHSLNRYPEVRDLFIKYNVALPSSAAVERLFSVAGMIATVKRNRLRPSLFESLLLQRVNVASH